MDLNKLHYDWHSSSSKINSNVLVYKIWGGEGRIRRRRSSGTLESSSVVDEQGTTAEAEEPRETRKLLVSGVPSTALESGVDAEAPPRRLLPLHSPASASMLGLFERRCRTSACACARALCAPLPHPPRLSTPELLGVAVLPMALLFWMPGKCLSNR
ncbi:hypothetical protein EJB05_56327, partial [Eragrostis curvula]